MGALADLKKKYDLFLVSPLVSDGKEEKDGEKKLFESVTRVEGKKKVVFVDSVEVLAKELGGILRRLDLHVVNDQDSFGLSSHEIWQTKEWTAISRALFLMFGPLFDHLHIHPAEKITHKNIMEIF